MKKNIMSFLIVISIFVIFPSEVFASNDTPLSYTKATQNLFSGPNGTTYGMNGISDYGSATFEGSKLIDQPFTIAPVSAGSSLIVYTGVRSISIGIEGITIKPGNWYKVVVTFYSSDNFYPNYSRINDYKGCNIAGNWSACENLSHSGNGMTVTTIFYSKTGGDTLLIEYGNPYNSTSDTVFNVWQNRSQYFAHFKATGVQAYIMNDMSGELNQIGQNQKETTNAIKDQTEQQKGWFGNLTSGIGNVFTSIIELPGKIVNLLIDGLKSLIVPSQSDLENLIGNMQEPLSQLGFVGEIMDYGMRLIQIPLNLSATGDLPKFELGRWCFPLPKIGEICLVKEPVVWDMNSFRNNAVISILITTLRLYTSYLIVLAFVRRWNFNSPLELIKGVGKR